MSLTDRTAIVTGASSGIGAATARTLAEEGCAVALAARRADRLHDVAADLDAETTLVVPTDITDEEAVSTLIDRTVDAFGGIDILVNNAGVNYGDPVADADPTEVRRQIEVNLLGAMATTREGLPHLLDGGGDVVTVSSLNARYPAEGAAAYTASKFGVNGFCRSLRKEMADEPVRVTVVMPGPVETEMRRWTDWSGRPCQPEAVAETIAFVVSRPPHVEIAEVSVDSTDKL